MCQTQTWMKGGDTVIIFDPIGVIKQQLPWVNANIILCPHFLSAFKMTENQISTYSSDRGVNPGWVEGGREPQILSRGVVGAAEGSWRVVKYCYYILCYHIRKW